MSATISLIARFRTWCAHAFAVDAPQEAIRADEEALADRMAQFVVSRRLTTPALKVIESGRPLNFLGSQALTFLSPFLTLVFRPAECERFIRFLEKRQSIDVIVNRIIDRESDRDG